MKLRLTILVLGAAAFAFMLSGEAQSTQEKETTKPSAAAPHSHSAAKKPLKLIGAILVPGNPIRFDISWVDEPRGRYFLAESGNAAVDVFDADNDLFIRPNKTILRGHLSPCK